MPSKHGALGATFSVVRAMEACCLIAIIGMTANFIAEMVASNQAPPHVLIGTLSVVHYPLYPSDTTNNRQTCIAVLYVTITYILYMDNFLPFLISCALDSALLIAIIVVAVTVGKPLSYLDCAALPNTGTTSSFFASVGINMSKVNYWVWAGASKTTCYEMKAIWGLSIALCVLFAVGSIVSVCLWKMLKTPAAKQIEA